ncbi:hypothetical protein ES708_28420 [subsurface metagenome]
MHPLKDKLSLMAEISLMLLWLGILMPGRPHYLILRHVLLSTRVITQVLQST